MGCNWLVLSKYVVQRGKMPTIGKSLNLSEPQFPHL